MTAAGAAIVTGGGGDIGAAICRRLGRNGWTVIVVDRDGDAAEKVAGSLAAAGSTAEAREVDVTERTQVEALVRDVTSRHGGLGALVNNVGIEGAIQPLTSYPEDVFERVMRINVHSVFLGLSAALRVMVEAGSGVIVNTASTSAIRGRANLAGYIASKHAVLGLTKVAALEVVGTGIRVNAVLPGPIETRMIRAINEGTQALSGADGDEVKRAVAVPYGTVDDVAAAVSHLLSADARHINGASVVVDGGSTVA
ncbi:SDR family NAD(P)-dependent oxidoreductase [Saccharopolyspora hirsuta]|uniref:SDR family oxidoreductase n=2 Tax=Pseudonocardiaceae TaxID=2070 RepID=A0A5M7B5T2_SACHI|nr:SDR family NAD(P)-dependent oxidoreductase [Saccharopolyspora hirsuta]KAA5824906.1 SDR family oxidoreductase [Saccharopolyspora hirsuta]